MSGSGYVPVTGRDGFRGELLDLPPYSDSVHTVRVRLTDGRQIEVSSAELIQQPDGSYYLPLSASDVPAPQNPGTVVQVVEERLEVGKRTVATGSVRVDKKLVGHDELIDMPLMREEVDVRRVLINRDVDSVPLMREEGGVLIVPLVEEILVVEKRLRLREEVHITRRRFEERYQEKVTLIREEAEVTRTGPDGVAAIEPIAQSETAPPLPKEAFVRKNRIIT